MFTGYVAFGGVELVNDARTAAYAAALNLPGGSYGDCGSLAFALENSYVSPEVDAPWFDAALPESGEFAGLIVLSIEGTGGTGTRPVQELARGGAVIGPRRSAHREMTMTFMLLASSQAGAAYGAAWLTQQLRGRDCSVLAPEYGQLDPGRVCGSDVLCMFTACPASPAEAASYRVNLFDVGVSSGPAVQRSQVVGGSSECPLAIAWVEVVFSAGDPSWYAPPVRLVDAQLSDHYIGSSAYDIRTTYSDLGCGTEACFDQTPEGCQVTNGPNMIAPPSPCVGIPSFTANFYSIPLDLSGVSSQLPLVPLLYYTGSPATPATSLYEGPVAFQLRRTTPEHPCGTVANPCEVCAELFTAHQRRQRRGVLDFRQRKAFRTVSAVPVCPYPVFTRELTPFMWPTLTCGASMCLDVYVRQANDGRGQRIELDVLRRMEGIA